MSIPTESIVNEKNTHQIRINEFAYLFTKVVDELRNPKQFVSPHRAFGLFSNGIRYLIGITRRIQTKSEEAEEEISSSLLYRRREDGLAVCYSKANLVQIVSFPFKARFTFYSPERARDSKGIHRKSQFQFRATTTVFNDRSKTYLPSQGYKNDQGILRQFVDNKPELIPQYGGIYIDREGRIDLIDYNILQKMKKKKFRKGEILIGANWFMTSLNQNQVLSTSEHRIRKAYNGIGLALTNNGERQYFHVCSTGPYVAKKVFDQPDLENYNVMLSDIAATVNAMQKRMGWQSWTICGLEYNGGSLVYIEDTGIENQPHFTVRFNNGKSSFSF